MDNLPNEDGPVDPGTYPDNGPHPVIMRFAEELYRKDERTRTAREGADREWKAKHFARFTAAVNAITDRGVIDLFLWELDGVDKELGRVTMRCRVAGARWLRVEEADNGNLVVSAVLIDKHKVPTNVIVFDAVRVKAESDQLYPAMLRMYAKAAKTPIPGPTVDPDLLPPSVPEGGYAFPIPGFGATKYDQGCPPELGMTLRDYLAAAAIPSLYGAGSEKTIEQAVRSAYLVADAMIAARVRPGRP